MLHTTELPLAFFSYVCYHARVRVCVHIPMGAYVPLGLAVSHAVGLAPQGVCVCLGVGASAVLGPLQRRFAFVLIQTHAARLLRRLSSERRAEGGVERIWRQK